MQIKKYLAPNVQEALKQVKQELGPEALILSVRNIKAGNLGALSPARVEVTAAIDQQVQQAQQVQQMPGRRYTSEKTYSRPSPLVKFERSPSPSPSTDQIAGVRRYLPDLKSLTEGAKNITQNMRQTLSNLRQRPGNSSWLQQTQGQEQGLGLGLSRSSSEAQGITISSALSGSLEPRGDGQASSNPSTSSRINSQSQSTHAKAIKPNLKLINNDRIASLSELLENIGLQEDIIRHILEVLSEEIISSGADYSRLGYDSFRMEGLAREILQQLIKTSGPLNLDGQSPRYVALVGPTGSGKTTTIAKLAAEAMLKRNKKVGLITVDSYRVGAMEQLNTYAGIMNIPVKQAASFEQMRKAVLQYQDRDLVLIDTAGFSHHDREHLQLLNAFLAQVSQPDVHLVLSINTSERELVHISQKFSILNYKHIIFTKLDESSYPGTIFNQMVYTGKPVSYITTGQKVPDDIEVATQAGIIRIMFEPGKPVWDKDRNMDRNMVKPNDQDA